MRYRKYNTTKTNIDGFTLLEVLIASVILFSSIAAVSLIYRGAYLSSEKATNTIKLSSVLPSILTVIEAEIKQQSKLPNNALSGKGNAWQVSYSWKAELVSMEKAPDRIDPNSGANKTSPLKYKLWQVDLTTKFNNKEALYSYVELGWNDE